MDAETLKCGFRIHPKFASREDWYPAQVLLPENAYDKNSLV
jgi:hypothetical protein